MKKIFSITMAFLLTASLLAACGSKPPASGADASETGAAQAKTGETQAAEAQDATAPASGEAEGNAAGGTSETMAKNQDLAAAKYLSGDYPALPADGPALNFTLAHSAAENSDQHAVMAAFKEALEYYSGGKIAVTIYPNGQLGSDAEIINSCIAGDIDFVQQTSTAHTTLIPEAAIFDTPFLLTGYDISKIEEATIDSEFRRMYDGINEEQGLKCMMVVACETMNLTSNRAARSLPELKGLKIRTPQSDSRMAFWKSLGANPTPLAFGELYISLQNGTVDAQDNTWANAVLTGAGELQKYMIPTGHMRASYELLMNKEKFDSLPAEYRELIKKLSDEVNRYHYDLSSTNEKAFFDQLQTQYKLEVCEIDDHFLNAMREAAKSAVESTHAAVGNEALYDSLQKALEQ